MNLSRFNSWLVLTCSFFIGKKKKKGQKSQQEMWHEKRSDTEKTTDYIWYDVCWMAMPCLSWNRPKSWFFFYFPCFYFQEMQFKHLCLFSFFLLSVLAASIDRHKRDVVDLHHSGGTKTTTTAMTARPTTQPTASPYPAASSDPGKWNAGPLLSLIHCGSHHLWWESHHTRERCHGRHLDRLGSLPDRLWLSIVSIDLGRRWLCYVWYRSLLLFSFWLNSFRSHHLGGHDQQSTLSRLYEQQHHHDRRTGRTGSLGRYSLCPLLVHLDLPDGGRGWIGLGSLYLVL